MFAQKIKQWRQRRFLTQQGLADKLDASLSTVQKWEMGRTLPYPTMRQKLIELLEIDADEFFAAIEASQAEADEAKNAAA